MGTSHRSFSFLYFSVSKYCFKLKNGRKSKLCDNENFLPILFMTKNYCLHLCHGAIWGPRWSSGKESARQCRRRRRYGFDPGLGRSPGGGNGNPLQFCCLKNPMSRGAWGTTVHGGHEESDMIEQLSTHGGIILTAMDHVLAAVRLM